MSNIILYEDRNGSVKHIRATWHIKQPSSSSNEKRNQFAKDACERRARQLLDEWNESPLPMTFEFHHVNLVGNEGVWSKTKKNPITGVRRHEAGGVGVAELYYTLDSDADFEDE